LVWFGEIDGVGLVAFGGTVGVSLEGRMELVR